MFGQNEPALPAMYLAVIFALSPLTPCLGYLEDCITVPRPPLNGKLVYQGGTISARLKCAKKGYDLPNDAPGDGGILVCDPRKKTYDFDDVPSQTCLKTRRPTKISMDVESHFTAPSCDTDVEAHLLIHTYQTFKKAVPKDCSTKFKCDVGYKEPQPLQCGDNYSFDDGFEKQIMVTLNISTETYNPKMSAADYMKELHDLNNKYLKGLVIQRRESDVWMYHTSYILDWKAVCTGDVTSAGTSLYRHRVASCRGCSKNFVMNVNSGLCEKCQNYYYTPKPRFTQCIPCPNSNQMDPAQFNKECFNLD